MHNLLVQFFTYYAVTYRFQNDIISVRKGGTSAHAELRFVTGEFSSRADNTVFTLHHHPGVLHKESHISNPARWRFSIEDPFEVTRDLGSLVVTRPAFYKLHSEFQRAAHLLTHHHPGGLQGQLEELLEDANSNDICMRCGGSGHVLVTCETGRGRKDSSATENDAALAAANADGSADVEMSDEDAAAEAESLLMRMCYICGSLTHALRQCPRYKACLVCGGLDHQVRDCPSRNRGHQHDNRSNSGNRSRQGGHNRRFNRNSHHRQGGQHHRGGRNY